MGFDTDYTRWARRSGELFATAAEMKMPALGITDHGYLFGAYEFWKKSKKYGVKPSEPLPVQEKGSV